MGHPTPTAGWYPDPEGQGGKRYWDGGNWGPPVPQKKRRTWPIVLGAGVVVIGLSVAIGSDPGSAGDGAVKSGSCGDLGPTCDATPKVDGLYRVAGGGLFDGGISPGWIATNGVRSDAKACMWARLSGPANRLEFVIKGGNMKRSDDEVYVHVEGTDNSFWSQGCQPWVRIDRK